MMHPAAFATLDRDRCDAEPLHIAGGLESVPIRSHHNQQARRKDWTGAREAFKQFVIGVLSK